MDVLSWSSILVEAPWWVWAAAFIICCSLFADGLWLLASALDKVNKFRKGKGEAWREASVEATVGGKYICHPRGPASEPVLLVSEKDRAAVRKNGKCELMVTVTCVGGLAFAEWVTPKFFDSVELGSKVAVAYTEDPKTHVRHCVSMKKK